MIPSNIAGMKQKYSKEYILLLAKSKNSFAVNFSHISMYRRQKWSQLAKKNQEQNAKIYGRGFEPHPI
jgi:hypothetical protein